MIQALTSPDNSHIKLTGALRQKKHRDATGLFVAEGLRFVGEASDSGWQLQFAIVSEAGMDSDSVAKLVQRLDGDGCEVFIVPAAVYDKISETETPQGISLIVRQQKQVLADWQPSPDQTPWLVLDSIQDPGNVGTMIRTADAAGAAGVILAGNCADVYAGKTARASMGSLFHLPVFRATADECLEFFSRCHLPAYIAGTEAATDYTSADLSGAFAVVMGNEGAGVGEAFRCRLTQALRIPLSGRAESLNVGAAAAVILFEAARQRMTPGR